MNTSYALEVLTGFLALFGLNTPNLFPRLHLSKSRPAVPALPEQMNSELLSSTGENPDMVIQPGLSPLPTPTPMGVELTGAGEQARRTANALALEEARKREPDQDILRRYSGGGGIGESIDAYYTPQALAKLMWQMLEAGMKKPSKKRPYRARVLDPTCGSGALLIGAPEHTELTGVEYDKDAALIAEKILPHAAIYAVPFERFTTRSSVPSFDMAIMNPPFGNRGNTRDLHEPEESRSERYIMRQTIRRVSHGGLIAAVLPLNLFYGEQHQAFRRELLATTLPLHLIAVPTGAFKASGAGITTVIALLRRHDVGVAEAVEELTDEELTTLMVDYSQDMIQRQLIQKFIQGESVVMDNGKDGQREYALSSWSASCRLSSAHLITYGRYGQPLLEGDISESSLSTAAEQGIAAQKAKAVSLNSVLGTIRIRVPQLADKAAIRAAQAPLHAIADGTKTAGGRFVFRLGQWQPVDDFGSPIIKDAMRVTQELNFYLDALNQNRTEAPKLRGQVELLDREFQRKHGPYPVKQLTRLSHNYPLFGLLLASLGEEGLKLPEPKKVELPLTPGTPLETALQLADLLALTEANLMQYAGISQSDAEKLLKTHFAFTGELWVEKGVYFAGNALLRAELAQKQAQGYGGYEREALLRQADTFLSLVRRVPINDIRLSPRDPVIPVHILEAWVNAYLGSLKDEEPLVSVIRERGAVQLSRRGGADKEGQAAAAQFNQQRAQALEAYLNHKTQLERIEDKSKMTREEQAAARAVVIDDAQAYEDAVQNHFSGWLADSEFVQEMEEAYTWTRGANVRAQGSTRPLNITDWRGPTPHPYQAADVRIMAAVAGIINNYDVGLGKTFETLLLVAYLKQCGRARRPIICVPAGLVSNWAVSVQRALPSWRVTIVGMTPKVDREGKPVYKRKLDGSVMIDDQGEPIQEWTEDSPEIKKAKIAQLAAGTTDLIIMSRESFTGIGMQRDTRERMLRTDPQVMRDLTVQDRYDAADGKKHKKRDQLVRETETFGLLMSKVKVAHPGDLSFEMLGCDFIAHDEGHELRNIYDAPSVFGEKPQFLGSGGTAQRAIDAQHKGRYIREQGGQTYLFTASWVKNSPMEVFSMLSQVTDDLPNYGLLSQEVLVEQYLRIEPDIIAGRDGEVNIRPCVTGFQRLKELRGIISGYVITRSYGDPEVVKADGTPLDVPKAEAEEVMIDMHPEQSAAYAQLRAEARSADPRARGDKHPFAIMAKMRKLTVEPALMGLDCANPRFEAIAELVQQNRAEGHKAIVFMSIGEQGGAFERLKEVLVARGYPAREIEIVSSHTHKSSVERQDLQDRYNFGDLTLILGTDVLGQGFNLQYGTGMIINADIPWNFEEIRQRTGRGARQGNTLKKLRNIYLLQRGSFDSMTYTIMSGKKAWQQELWGDADELSNTAGGFNGEQMALLMSDDPDATKAQIDEKRGHLSELTAKAQLRRQMETLSAAIAVRNSLRSTVHIANERKLGWTANDHTLVTQKQRAFARLSQDVERLKDFPFGKLLKYRGEIAIYGELPLHIGLQVDIDGETWEVTSFGSEEATLVSPGGVHLNKDIRSLRGLPLKPSPYPEHYQEESLAQSTTMSWDAQAKIHIINPQGAALKPKDQEGVLTICLHGNAWELLDRPEAYTVRSHLNQGATVLHVMVRPDGSHLSILGVAVLCASPKGRERLLAVKESDALKEQFAQVAAQSIGANLIKSRVKAA
ncbi:helicase domain protein (plasmid) [Deinococcus proteolyticus MRP]|uniref:Helicase domain protein n=1 Tax=Deinococcus proteolyticus (strain ATCC 35074 / DSM 20540 / JCM 6276 / NBRC 101906 / NCIMB 13154 / VKM Ac-1939 / CCM 2703 / MRP) TaxID=693977 RepID=F0RQB3_DEIPM|nr:helicase-related protein [Deinococcus proteolyticus]ADY27472.1 helicase domain protein [Deinococcus proteolyticus MRP]